MKGLFDEMINKGTLVNSMYDEHVISNVEFNNAEFVKVATQCYKPSENIQEDSGLKRYNFNINELNDVKKMEDIYSRL